METLRRERIARKRIAATAQPKASSETDGTVSLDPSLDNSEDVDPAKWTDDEDKGMQAANTQSVDVQLPINRDEIPVANLLEEEMRQILNDLRTEVSVDPVSHSETACNNKFCCPFGNIGPIEPNDWECEPVVQEPIADNDWSLRPKLRRQHDPSSPHPEEIRRNKESPAENSEQESIRKVRTLVRGSPPSAMENFNAAYGHMEEKDGVPSRREAKRVEFLIDSECSVSCCSDRSLLYKPVEHTTIYGQATDHVQMVASHKGELRMSTPLGVNLSLPQINYAKDLNANVLSTFDLRNAGWEIVMPSTERGIHKYGYMTKNGKTIWIDDLDGKHNRVYLCMKYMDRIADEESIRLLHIEQVVTNRRSPRQAAQDASDFAILHRRGAHILSKCPGYECAICARAKATWRKPGGGDRHKGKDRILVDIIGPLRRSSTGMNYICNIVHDTHRYGLAVPLRSKADVVIALKLYLSCCPKPKYVQTDGAAEFVGGHFRDYAIQMGIQPLITTPYHHHHQGLIERRNRSLSDAIRCILLEARANGVCMDAHWHLACNYANYILNRTATQVLGGVSPYQVLNGKKPRFSKLRMFGCRSMAKIPPEKAPRSQKMEQVAVEGRFVGVFGDDEATMTLAPDGQIYISNCATTFEDWGAKDVPAICPEYEKELFEVLENTNMPQYEEQYQNEQSVFEDSVMPDEYIRQLHIKDLDNMLADAKIDDFKTYTADCVHALGNPTDDSTRPTRVDYPDGRDRPDAFSAEGAKAVSNKLFNTPWIRNVIKDIGALKKHTHTIRDLLAPENTLLTPHQLKKLALLIAVEEMLEENPLVKGGSEIEHIRTLEAITQESEPGGEARKEISVAKAKEGELTPDVIKKMEEEIEKHVKYDCFREPTEEDWAQYGNRIKVPCKMLIIKKRCGKIRARIVILGFLSKSKGNRYGAVVNSESVRTALAVASGKPGWGIRQADFSSAFLQAPYPELVIVQLSKDMQRFLKYEYAVAQKCVNGMPRGSYAWAVYRDAKITELGWSRCNIDGEVWYKKGICMLTYVDDIMLMGEESLCDEEMAALFSMFEMREEVPADVIIDGKAYKEYDFLNLQIAVNDEEFLLHQCKYIKAATEKVLEKFGQDDLNVRDNRVTPASTPIQSRPEPEEALIDKALHHAQLSIGGMVRFVTTWSRPDTEFAAHACATAKPAPVTITTLKRSVQYLQQTKAMVYRRIERAVPEIVAYADADFAGFQDGRCVSGLVVFVNGCPVAWKSRRQDCIALNTTEAELIALSECCKVSLRVQTTVEELTRGITKPPHVTVEVAPFPVQTYTDNRSAHDIVNGTQGIKSTVRHIRVRHLFCRQLVATNAIKVAWVKGTMNPADGFTKPLETGKFLEFCTGVKMRKVTMKVPYVALAGKIGEVKRKGQALPVPEESSQAKVVESIRLLKEIPVEKHFNKDTTPFSTFVKDRDYRNLKRRKLLGVKGTIHVSRVQENTEKGGYTGCLRTNPSYIPKEWRSVHTDKPKEVHVNFAEVPEVKFLEPNHREEVMAPQWPEIKIEPERDASSIDVAIIDDDYNVLRREKQSIRLLTVQQSDLTTFRPQAKGYYTHVLNADKWTYGVDRMFHGGNSV